MSKQKVPLHVWVDNNEYWNWVYLGMNGKLYIRTEDGWDRLDNHTINKASGYDCEGIFKYAKKEEATT